MCFGNYFPCSLIWDVVEHSSSNTLKVMSLRRNFSHLATTSGELNLFRCVHTSHYEGLSINWSVYQSVCWSVGPLVHPLVSPSVYNEFFLKHFKTSLNSSEHLQTPPKPLILTILANCLPN